MITPAPLTSRRLLPRAIGEEREEQRRKKSLLAFMYAKSRWHNLGKGNEGQEEDSGRN